MIVHFESDIRKPSYKTLVKLSRGLCVSTDYLIGRRESGMEDLHVDHRIAEMTDGF